MRILIYLSCIALLSLASSCLKDPFSESAEDVAERIRANTPTELPPISSVGANTMGAYVEVDTGRVLFVASGVNRSGAVGTESSSCDALYSTLTISTNSLFIDATWCPRPEIGDDRLLKLGIGITSDGLIDIAAFNTGGFRGLSTTIDRSYVTFNNSMSITNLRRISSDNIISGEFHGLMARRTQPFDTIRIIDGRFDVTYGTTP